MRRTSFAIIISALTCLLLGSTLLASSPALSIITPRGAQRGTEAVFQFRGARLADAEEIFFYEPGFEVVKLEAKSASQLDVTLKIAADCRLGEHTAQVRTKSGISEYRTFFVGALAETVEKEPNTDFAAPQAIPLNSCVNGIVTGEDVDYYAVELKKGQRLSAEVEGMRLGSYLFDPYVAILDAKRFNLSADDDTPLTKQDAVASIVAPEDGKYIVEVRESAYGGNGNCRYRLHVGSFPRPKAVYPAGGKIGEKTAVRFIGDATGDINTSVQLPAALEEDYGLFATQETGVAPSSNPFRLYEHGNALEKEPNDALAQATPAALPLAFNGIIEKAGDVDYFKFAAKKGQVFEVECFARRLRSALDPVMNLYYANGKSIAGNDDSRGPDSYIRFTVPADGEYAVRVTDHLKNGGPEFVYRVEFRPIERKLTLSIPRVARYSQYRQTIFVPRGNRFATLLTASRQNFGGELVLDGANLPTGITMHADSMPANMSQMPVVFEAAADAPLGGALIDFTAHHVDTKTGIKGRFRNTADMVRGAPGNSIYVYKHVQQLAIAVVDELPFTLELVEPKVPLVQNGSMNLKVIAHKKEGWDEQINVQLPFRPPGVGTNSSLNIPKGKNELIYPINAAGNARVQDWKVYVLGTANVNGGAWVSSKLVNLKIVPPFVNIAMQKADVEQGQDTEIVCTVEQKTPFEGEATVELLGLPNRVTAEPLKFTKDGKDLVFKIKTDKVSPAGTHKSVFCRVTITSNGEPITHARVGATALRIDKPLPPKVAAPKPKPTPAKAVAKKPVPAKPPVVKRLTRLEKLRLEAKTRAEEGTK